MLAHLFTGQMASDTGLCTLADLDFEHRARVKIFSMHAETPRGHLYDGVGAILVEFLRKTALACIIEYAKLCRRARKCLMCVAGNGTERHRGEHHGHRQLHLRRHLRDQLSVLVKLELFGLAAQDDACLHGFAKRVDRRVRHL